METKLNLKSEKTRSLIGRIPCDFSIKGGLLALMIIIACYFTFFAIKIPTYYERPIHIERIDSTGTIYGDVVVESTMLHNAKLSNQLTKVRDKERNRLLTGYVVEQISFDTISLLQIEFEKRNNDTLLNPNNFSVLIKVEKESVFNYICNKNN